MIIITYLFVRQFDVTWVHHLNENKAHSLSLDKRLKK